VNIVSGAPNAVCATKKIVLMSKMIVEDTKKIVFGRRDDRLDAKKIVFIEK